MLYVWFGEVFVLFLFVCLWFVLVCFFFNILNTQPLLSHDCNFGCKKWQGCCHLLSISYLMLMIP